MGLATLVKIANRRRLGRISRKNSSRLPAASGNWFERAVTLPPGRAKLPARAVATGSPAEGDTLRITVVACLAATTAAVPDDIDLEADELGRDLGIPLAAALRPTILHCDVSAPQSSRARAAACRRRRPMRHSLKTCLLPRTQLS